MPSQPTERKNDLLPLWRDPAAQGYIHTALSQRQTHLGEARTLNCVGEEAEQRKGSGEPSPAARRPKGTKGAKERQRGGLWVLFWV